MGPAAPGLPETGGLRFDPIPDDALERAQAEAASRAASTASGPRWREPEIAWPIAMLAGFAGCALGLATTVPLLGALLAGVLIAPLILPLVESGRRGVAALCAVGWGIGVSGAVVGSALEVGYGRIVDSIPGAAYWTTTEVAAFAEPGGSPAALARSVGASVAVVLLAALLARPARGLLALPFLGWVLSVVAAGTGWFAQRAVQNGADPIPSVLAGTPPHMVLALLGALLLLVGGAGPGSVPSSVRTAARGADRPTIGRGTLLISGALCALLGWAVHALLRTTWGESLAPWLR